jgi:hypothetical protein
LLTLSGVIGIEKVAGWLRDSFIPGVDSSLGFIAPRSNSPTILYVFVLLLGRLIDV